METNQKKEKGYRVALCSIALLLIAVMYGSMYIFASPYAATWDAVDFSLALNRYDILAMQPHFPGYPYFILGGLFFYQFIDNPPQALAFFNITLMLSAFAPIYWICRRYCLRTESVLFTGLLLTASYTAIFITQPMSEGAALSVLLWYFWSLIKATETGKFHHQIVPIFLFSIITGIRLSYLPFGIGLILLWIKGWKESKESKESLSFKASLYKLYFYVIIAITFQLIWILGVAWTEGGIRPFLNISLAFVAGHFTEWGGTAVSNTDFSFFERGFTLLIENLFLVGITANSTLLMVVYSIIGFLFLCFKGYKLGKSIHPWIKLMGVAYFVWALFAQNIDKPRHILPLIAITLFIIILPLLRSRYRQFVNLFVLIIMIVQTFIGIELVKEQYKIPPASYQLNHYLDEMSDDSFIVYTWEEARVMDYLEANFAYKEIYTYDYFLQDLMLYKEKKVFLTDHVVKGFESQGIVIKPKLKKIAEFHSNKLFDPVYSDIILYELNQ